MLERYAFSELRITVSGTANLATGELRFKGYRA
jgi:hypothetical protein